MFKTHIVFSYLISILVWPVFQADSRILFTIAFLFGAVLPDIDSSTSFIGRKLKLIGWISRHRGFYHSLFPPLILFFALSPFIGTPYTLAVIAGFLSHLVLDMLNHQGVGLFNPIIEWRIKGFLKSGGIFESVIFIGCIVGIVMVGF